MRQHESWYHVRMRHPTRGVLKQGRLKGAIDKYFATPAIADGRIYVRTKNRLYAFGK